MRGDGGAPRRNLRATLAAHNPRRPSAEHERYPSRMTRIALVTHAGQPRLSDDDRLLADALASRGGRAEAAPWDDPAIDWRAFDAVVVRSAWNYHHDVERFLAWVDELAAGPARLLNPPELLRWSAGKRYLFDLARRGVPIADSVLVEAGEARALAAIAGEHRWTELVVKPVVSASAHETWRVRGAPSAADEARFARLVATRAMLVQRYLPQVAEDGEWSFVFVDGVFSHAVVKRPAAGDFRVQREHGGTAASRTPAPALLDDARAVLARVTPCPLYARVDGCALAGRLLLMELELVEPALFLAHAPRAADRLAEAVLRRVG